MMDFEVTLFLPTVLALARIQSLQHLRTGPILGGERTLIHCPWNNALSVFELKDGQDFPLAVSRVG